jgi:competence protein ComEC
MKRAPFDRIVEAAHRLVRFAMLHPALGLSLVALARGLAGEIELPSTPAEAVEVVGMVRTLPELDEGRLRFELDPVRVCTAVAPVEPAGRILVTVAGGEGRPDLAFLPPLVPGERIAFRAALDEPSFYAVPAVPDFRREARARGLYWRVALKSPAQLERLGPEPGLRAAVLRVAGSYVNRFRSYLATGLDPESGGWIDTLLLALQGGLPAERWEDAAEVGLVHLLVVSGLHVGVIAGVAHLVFRPLGWAAVLPVWALVGLYVTLIGLPPPAGRAALMIGCAYLARSLGLQSRPLNALGLAALALLLDAPELAHSRSFQFTFASVAALLALGTPAWRRVRTMLGGLESVGSASCDLQMGTDRRAARWIRFQVEAVLGFLPALLPWVRDAAKPVGAIGSLALASAVVVLGTLPLTLYHTNLFPVWSIPANVLVLPVFGVVVPLAFTLLLLYWTPAGDLVAVVGALALEVFERLLDWLGKWGGGLWVRAPHLATGAVYLLAVAAVVRLPRWWKAAAALLPAALLVWLAHPRPSPDGNIFQLTVLEVGQGDAIHLRYPDGSHALVDTGGSRFDRLNRRLARRVLGRYLLAEGARALEFVLVTHPEADHMGSLAALGRMLPVRRLLFHLPPPVMGAEPVRLQQGDRWTHAGVEHSVLHPPAESGGFGTNDGSVVLLLRYGSCSALLTGDIGRRVEASLDDRLTPATVLKVAHHGSSTSTSRGLLAAVRPAVALISAGRRSAFGHPSPKVTALLEEEGVHWWSTSTSGSLRWSTDGGSWRLSGYDLQRQEFGLLAEGGVGR